MKKTLFEKNKNKLSLPFILSSFVLILMLFSNASQAISLTTYRMYLDNNNRTESFIMFNNRYDKEKCSIKIKHFNFDENGKMSAYKKAELPDNSAVPWVRYSPKNFTVERGRPQTVRFSMRRKANVTPQEYRSYLSVSCDKALQEINTEEGQPATNPNGPSFRAKPKLVQNVPLVIRTGKLQATAEFDDIKVVGKKLTAKLIRKGDRSLYGQLALIDKRNNTALGYKNSVSIYTETSSYAFDFSLASKDTPPLEHLMLRFTEDENYGGSLVIEKDVK